MTDKTPLQDAIADLEKLPKLEGQIGVVADPHDVGVAGSVSTPIGKSWRVAAAGHWWKEKGWQVAAMLGWKKR